MPAGPKHILTCRTYLGYWCRVFFLHKEKRVSDFSYSMSAQHVKFDSLRSVQRFTCSQQLMAHSRCFLFCHLRIIQIPTQLTFVSWMWFLRLAQKPVTNSMHFLDNNSYSALYFVSAFNGKSSGDSIYKKKSL